MLVGTYEYCLCSWAPCTSALEHPHRTSTRLQDPHICASMFELSSQGRWRRSPRPHWSSGFSRTLCRSTLSESSAHRALLHRKKNNFHVRLNFLLSSGPKLLQSALKQVAPPHSIIDAAEARGRSTARSSLLFTSSRARGLHLEHLAKKRSTAGSEHLRKHLLKRQCTRGESFYSELRCCSSCSCCFSALHRARARSTELPIIDQKCVCATYFRQNDVKT